MSTPSTDNADRVVVHLHVTLRDRARMRAIAALQGVTLAELVSGWAIEEAARLGLPDLTQGEEAEDGRS